MRKINVLINLLVVVQLVVACDNSPQPETYLIASGFTGRVNVIFNQKGTHTPKCENGRRIYLIPENGILLTQFAAQYGLVDHQYYYLKKNGGRRRIPILRDEEFKDGSGKRNGDEIGVFLDGTTGQYGKPPKALWWQEFVVCSYNNMDRFFTLSYRRRFQDTLRILTGISDLVIP